RDVPAYVLLDCSASMAIGNPPKFRLARVVVAIAAYQALADGRRCGLSAFAGRVVSDLPAVRGLSRIGRVLRFLENLSPQGNETDLAQTAEDFVRRYQPHGTVTVITDCHDRTGYARGLQILAARGYKPKLVHLYALCEADPGLLGDVELFDVESQRIRRVVVTERTAARYRQHFNRFCDSVRDECSRCGIACLQATGDAPEDDVLQSVLRSEISFL
ncbi:MAG: VWA domain-containing protein, partial [Thermoguttaceae bacterium]